MKTVNLSDELSMQIKKNPNDTQKGISAPLVSILIPVYNHPHFLEQCLESILIQDFKDYEIVVKEDFCPERKAITKVVDSFIQKFNIGNRFKYILNHCNQGYIENRHEGISKYCIGKYCIIVDHDDFFLYKESLSLFVSAFQNNPQVTVVTSNIFVLREKSDNKNALLAKFDKKSPTGDQLLLKGNEYFLGFWNRYSPTIPAAAMFNRQKALERNWLNTKCNDQSIHLLLAPGSDTIILLDELVCYRIHSLSIIRTVQVELVFDSHLAIEEWIKAAKINSDISFLRLWIWRIKTLIHKEAGGLIFNLSKSPGQLQYFLCKLKQYNLFHYYVVRYLNPTIIELDRKNIHHSQKYLTKLNCKMKIVVRKGFLWAFSGFDLAINAHTFAQVNWKGKLVRLIFNPLDRIFSCFFTRERQKHEFND